MKRFTAFLLIFCLVFMVIGCGGTAEKPDNDATTEDPVEDPEDDSGDDPGEDPAEEPTQLEAFYQIEEIYDIVKNFKELSYTFSDPSSVLTVDYQYKGEDTVGGSSADHVSISISQEGDITEVEIWMDGSGNVLQAVLDGQELDAMQAPMATIFLTVILVPFVMHAGEWEEAFVSNGYEQLGWVVTNRSQESRNFGAVSATVHQYSFNIKDLGGGQDLSYRFEVAEISGKSMFVGWEIDVDQEHTSSFKVDRVITR